MRIDFFLNNIIQDQTLIVYNLFSNVNYEFENFFWFSKNQNNGDIFLAIQGNNTNGNLFIDEAIKSGYKAVLSDNLFIIEEKAKVYDQIIFIVVRNVGETLNRIASWGLEQFKGMKFAVTGSNGKSTTTYLLANLLKHFGKVICTDKYNSQYFLKRLCFSLYKSDANFFVAELSSDRLGYIDLYGSIIQPDYSIVTSIASAHLEHFKSESNILVEKTSLFPHTKKAGFIPIKYKKQIEEQKLDSKLTNVRYVPEDFIVDGDRVKFYNGVELNSPKFKGIHNYSNINLILHLLDAAGFGTNKTQIQNTLNNINCFPGRGNQITIDLSNYQALQNDHSFLTLVCEHHNSNKSSFISAISNITEPTIVVMGYFYEMGERTDVDTNEVLSIMENNSNIKYVFFGDEKLFDINGITKYKKIVSYQKDILTVIEQALQHNVYQVFFKGSRGSKLERYIEKILNYFNS